MERTLLVTLLMLGAACAASYKFDVTYSALYNNNTNSWAIVQGTPSEWVAWAVVRNHLNESGWYILEVETNNKQENHLQSYAAGLLEGALTQPMIWDAWLTFYNSSMNFTYPAALENWLMTNDKWARNQAKTYGKDDGTTLGEYWAQVDLVYSQIDGLLDGYNMAAPSGQPWTYAQMLLWQASDDYPDIDAAISHNGARSSFNQYIAESHCSSLIKLTADGKNLFSAHVTWSSFTSMLRIYKHYNFAFNLKSNKAPRSSFSSGPGYLVSGDDWYLTNTNLMVTETTNNVFNMSLYQYVQPQSVLYWVRVIVANRMATSGPDWTKYFTLFNSGTYNNQWIILDYKLFTPGQQLKANTLWIAEQIPGYIVSQDVTSTVQTTGYWASYNIPYSQFVYNISGYPAQYEQNGNFWSYTMCPRAQIFRRDQGAVQNVEEFKHIMRYNKWQTDPLSLGNACDSISARCDLNPPNLNPFAFGGIDCKFTDQHMSPKMLSHAVCGPTYQSQPVFAWTDQWEGVPRYGQPTVFDFPFVPMQPSGM